jgi:SAM-dependent methyltransferase
MAARYDSIGRTYTATRQTEPRIAARIWEALGDARTVVNVGAGAGSYEPPDREVTAVEPSAVMLAQRAPSAARAVQATAEDLPFADDAFDAAMAVLTLHHWSDWRAGCAELRRVARRRVVVFSWDPTYRGRMWLSAEYFPTLSWQDVADFRRCRTRPTSSRPRSRWSRSGGTAATASSAPSGGVPRPTSTPPCARGSRPWPGARTS